MKGNQKVKYVSIVFFSIILVMVFHVMASNYSTIPKVANWSFFVEKLGLISTIILWYLIAYGSIAYVFLGMKINLQEQILQKVYVMV